MGEGRRLRAAVLSEGRTRLDREPRHASGAGRALDGRSGRAVGGRDASGAARSADHRRRTAWPAAAVSAPDVAMAPKVARRSAPRAALGRRYHQEVSPAAAADLPDAARGRAARAAGGRAATEWRVGVSLRSGDARMAQAWHQDDPAEDQKDHDADAVAARRSE